LSNERSTRVSFSTAHLTTLSRSGLHLKT